MLVRRLVIGVRSSCEASATSWRCARTESSSSSRELWRRSIIALKRRRELADLVVGVDMDAAGQVLGLGDVLGGLGDLGERREHLARSEPSEHRRERDAACAKQEQDQAQAREDVVDAVERARELDRYRLVLDTDRELRGDDQLAQVAVADLDVLQVGVLVAGGDVAHL